MEIKKLLPEIKKNVSLKNYTSFKIGGRARYFYLADNKNDLVKAIEAALEKKAPFFILGKGSNVLVSDKGYCGLVIKVEAKKCKIEGPKIIAEAGLDLQKLVVKAKNKNLKGLEWAAGIPGSLGGAIYGNAGAFGRSMKDVVKEVEVLEIKNKRAKIKTLTNKECGFGYRRSVFKKNKKLIILSAVLQLKKGRKEEIEKKIENYLKRRRERHPLNFPSAGSIFKNPKGISAGELIEKCGLKGKRIGNVKFSEKHANFIVNLGKGKAEEVKKIIALAKEKAKKDFGIKLEEEIQYLGVFHT